MCLLICSYTIFTGAQDPETMILSTDDDDDDDHDDHDDFDVANKDDIEDYHGLDTIDECWDWQQQLDTDIQGLAQADCFCSDEELQSIWGLEDL
eukprot:COSAG01_NODE_16963_length_1189_cov_154.471560_2_plen_94_part_00